MVGLIFFVTLILLNNDALLAEECLGYSSFVITTGKSSESKHVAKFSVNSLKECIEKCEDVGKSCRAINLNMLEPSGFLECNLLESIGSGGSNLTFSFDNAGKLYAERICLPKISATCTAPWSFELIPNIEISSRNLNKFILKEDSLQNKEDCLGRCLNMDDCHAVQIDQNRKICKFISLSRHAFRKYDQEENIRSTPQMYIYENTCFGPKSSPKLNQSECKFFTHRIDRLHHIYNQLITNSNDVEQCESSCKSTGHTICRSFTYDAIKRNCYLSHMSNVVNTALSDYRQDFNGNFVYGELDDCVGLGLECSNSGMTVYGKTLKLFNGTFGVKSFDNDRNCYTQVTDALNFSFKISLNDCGTKQENDNVYTNTLQLKDSFTSLITYRDKLARVVCRLRQTPLEDILVTVQLHVLSNTTGEIILLQNDKPTQIKPIYHLRILNSDLSPVNTVHLGEYGYLEVSFDNVTDDEMSLLKMQVSNLTAKDIKNGKELNLFDFDGCPLNPERVGNFEYSSKGTLRSKLQFYGFTDSAKVYYKGDVRPCLGECSYMKCKSKNFERTKRDVHQMFSDERHPVTSDLVWHKNVRQLLDEKWNDDWNIKPLKLPKLLNMLQQHVSRLDYDSEEYDSSISTKAELNSNSTFMESPVTRCIIKNSSCLITVFVIIIQIVLFAICGTAIYFYCKFFRSRQKPNLADGHETITDYVPSIYSMSNDNEAMTHNCCDSL